MALSQQVLCGLRVPTPRSSLTIHPVRHERTHLVDRPPSRWRNDDRTHLSQSPLSVGGSVTGHRSIEGSARRPPATVAPSRGEGGLTASARNLVGAQKASIQRLRY